MVAKKWPKHDRNPQETKKHFGHDATACVFVGTRATREPQVLGRAKSTISPHKKKTTSSTHTACLQVCFVSAKSVENNLYINSCSHRRCGSTVPTTSTSHGWRTISVDTNRTNSNTTEPRCTSMHRRIAQRSGRRSHTPRVRLTDHGVGQHRPKL